MSKFIDLKGKRFGRLKVLEVTEKNKWGGSVWFCQCNCGKHKKIRGASLISGYTKSCGCLKRETGANNGKKSKIHGMSNSPEYRSWNGMKQRCLNKNNPRYKSYGGRGIKVCDRWNSFENFYEDIGKRPSKKHSLDRIDNNGNYEPNNCRWATGKQQNRNMRTNTIIKYKGKTMCMVEWAEELNIKYTTLWARIYELNWNIEKAFNFKD